MSLQVLLIVDRDRLRNEYAQLGRLSVALTASGCRIQAATPAPPFGDDHPADRPIGLGQPIQYEDRVAPWLRQPRVERMREQLERQPIDLIWAAGRETWPIAAALSRMLERPIAVEIDGYAEARALRRSRQIRTLVSGIITPSDPLQAYVRRKFSQADVARILPGIAVGALDRKLRRTPETNGPLGLSILGSGRSRTNDRAVLESLARLRETGCDFRCVMELGGKAMDATWRLVRKLQLSDVCTAIQDPSRVARLLAAGDVLIRASVENRIRPIVLEAMAEGTPVLTAPEPWLDHLNEEDGATIVEKPTTAAWTEALQRILSDDEYRTRQGERARNSVVTHNRSSDRANSVLMLFEQIVGRDSLPISP